MRKPVVPRVAAEDDLDRACDHYLMTAGSGVAVEFLHDFEIAIAFISKSPGSGSPRYGPEPDLSGLRSLPMKKFPLIFYIETEHYIDVWRVLHGNMDIPLGISMPTETPDDYLIDS